MAWRKTSTADGGRYPATFGVTDPVDSHRVQRALAHDLVARETVAPSIIVHARCHLIACTHEGLRQDRCRDSRCDEASLQFVRGGDVPAPPGYPARAVLSLRPRRLVRRWRRACLHRASTCRRCDGVCSLLAQGAEPSPRSVPEQHRAGRQPGRPKPQWRPATSARRTSRAVAADYCDRRDRRRSDQDDRSEQGPRRCRLVDRRRSGHVDRRATPKPTSLRTKRGQRTRSASASAKLARRQRMA